MILGTLLLYSTINISSQNINIQSDQPRHLPRLILRPGLERMMERMRGRTVFSLPTVRRHNSGEEHQDGPEVVRLADTYNGAAG